MRYLYGALVLLGFFILPTAIQAYTPDDFVMLVDTTIAGPGSTANNQFTIPTVGGGYDAVVDWGDGSTTTLSGTPGNVTHTYAAPGQYEVAITHNTPRGLPRIRYGSSDDLTSFSGSVDYLKVIEIVQWGTNPWASMRKAFVACDNLAITAVDTPDLSSVIDMAGMFAFNDSPDLNVGNWDVSTVENMNSVFRSATAFNEDLSAWNISSVTDMSAMFAGASSFNQPLGSWNLTGVTDLTNMFSQATAFNQPLGSWDVSTVTSMRGMFSEAAAFNQPLNTWNVSNVIDMQSMFYGAGITAFNQDLSTWDVSGVTNMFGMFWGSPVFNQDLSSWNVSSVTNLRWMFKDATAFNGDITSWNVSVVTQMTETFNGATAFNQDLSGWNIINVAFLNGAFSNSGLSSENYSAMLNSWSQLAVQNDVTLGAVGISYLDTAVTARQYLIDTYNWTIDDNGVYREPSNGVFVTVWDTRLDPATENELLIYATGGSGYNFSIDWGDGVIESYTSDPGGYITHTYSTPGIKTVTMTGMFPYFYAGCWDGGEYNKLIDVAQWGTTKWESFVSSFAGCTHLDGFSAADVPDLSQTTDMSNMFYGASNFNDNLSQWDVSNVTNMDNIFTNATAFNGDIRNWNVSNVTNMQSLFDSASSFNQDLSAWDISNASFDWIGFNGTALSTSNYTKILEAWSQLNVQPDLSFGEIGPSGNLTPYCTSAQAARDILANVFNWGDWTDGGPVPCKTATYLTSAGGVLVGETSQYIVDGEGGTAVTVVPSTGYQFVRWSDGLTANPRTDTNLTTDITVTALLESVGGDTAANGTKIGIRAQRLSEMVTNAPVIASMATFVSSVRDFLEYLTDNEAKLDELTAEERTNIIIALRDIIAFLLRFVPGV